jgi:hypothetical protein
LLEVGTCSLGYAALNDFGLGWWNFVWVSPMARGENGRRFFLAFTLSSSNDKPCNNRLWAPFFTHPSLHILIMGMSMFAQLGAIPSDLDVQWSSFALASETFSPLHASTLYTHRELDVLSFYHFLAQIESARYVSETLHPFT